MPETTPAGPDATGGITVSVIIAAHDAAAYIGAAIASARAQSLGSIEIIVVDDASRDGTRAIVERCAADDPRVRLVALPANGGPGRARNAGLARARGAWIAVLDADDTFAPERLERLVALGAETGAEIVADNLVLEHPGRSETLLPGGEEGTLVIDAPTFVAANRGRRNQGREVYGFLKPVIRRAFLDRHGIAYRDLRLAEDYFLCLDCLIHGARWVVTRAPMYRYAIRDDSLTATFKPAQLDAMAAVDRLLLGKPEVRADDAVRGAIADHLAAVTRAATWTRFVGAVRGRDPLLAGRIMLADAGAARDVLLESLTAAPRVLLRLARSGASLAGRTASKLEGRRT